MNALRKIRIIRNRREKISFQVMSPLSQQHGGIVGGIPEILFLYKFLVRSSQSPLDLRRIWVLKWQQGSQLYQVNVVCRAAISLFVQETVESSGQWYLQSEVEADIQVLDIAGLNAVKKELAHHHVT